LRIENFDVRKEREGTRSEVVKIVSENERLGVGREGNRRLESWNRVRWEVKEGKDAREEESKGRRIEEEKGRRVIARKVDRSGRKWKVSQERWIKDTCHIDE